MRSLAKRVVLLSLLEKHEVMLTCNGNDCLVPPKHRSDDILQLRLNYKFPTNMNLEADDDALHVTLSFDKKDFRCTLPWHAIYRLHVEGKEDILFLPDVPWHNTEFSSLVLRNGQIAGVELNDESGAPVTEAVQTEPSKPRLKVVQNAEE